jgi:hypothetical protein
MKTNIEELLMPVQYFCAATSFEQFCLWQSNFEKISWVEDRKEIFYNVGLIDDDLSKPVNVVLSFATIENKVICFFDVVSRYNDKQMVSQFIEQFTPKYNGRLGITNAPNFHHMLLFLKHV